MSILIQYQVNTAVSYSELIARINSAPLKKSQSHRLNDQIAAKEKELTRITRYKQSLYQDWKDGEITQQEYRDMKADYERQAADLSDVLARLTAERAELANGVDYITTDLNLINTRITELSSSSSTLLMAKEALP